mgnify:CR=1 FL=1
MSNSTQHPLQHLAQNLLGKAIHELVPEESHVLEQIRQRRPISRAVQAPMFGVDTSSSPPGRKTAASRRQVATGSHRCSSTSNITTASKKPAG